MEITDWLDKHGNPEIYKKVEDFLKKTNMKNKIPTAEEILIKHSGDVTWTSNEEAKNAMIEFTKMHVKAAKEAWFEKIKSEGLVTDKGIAYLDNVYPKNLIK